MRQLLRGPLIAVQIIAGTLLICSQYIVTPPTTSATPTQPLVAAVPPPTPPSSNLPALSASRPSFNAQVKDDVTSSTNGDDKLSNQRQLQLQHSRRVTERVEADATEQQRTTEVFAAPEQQQAQLSLNAYDTARCRTVTSVPDPFVSTSTVANALAGPLTPSGTQLLLMTHSRLLWFDTATHTETLLREERDARFRGAFIGAEGASLVVLTTPDLRAESIFVELSLPQGDVLRRVRAEGTRDGHEAVRYGDRAYVVSTGTGSVNVYDARTLALHRRHALWSPRDHINTIALTPSTMHVMVHFLRRTSSEVHIVERARDVTVGRIANVGNSSHGLAMWNHELITLDSDGAKLMAGPLRGDSTVAGDTRRVLWASSTAGFLKGLCILDGVAYFGASPPQRRLLRRRVNSTLIAVDLASGRELLRREMPTHGLLNLIAHPAYLAAPRMPLPIPLSAKLARQPLRQHGSQVDIPPHHRVVSLGPVDVADLRTATIAQWQSLWSAHDFGHLFPGLAGYEAIFRGIKNAKLVFSASPEMLRKELHRLHSSEDKAAIAARDALPWPKTARWRVVFPAWRLLRGVLLPLFDEVFGRRMGLGPSYTQRILRVQMNRMPPLSNVGPHVDRGFYANNAHRYHFPLIVPRCVRFAHIKPSASAQDVEKFTPAAWDEIPMKEGEVFEVNNVLKHRVEQTGPHERVTVIVDLLDEPVDTTIEVTPTCPSWFDTACYASANVSDAAFRGAVR